MVDIYKSIFVGLACGLIILLLYYVMTESASTEGTSRNPDNRLIYAIYTTSADTQTLDILKRYYFATSSPYHYVIDDTADKSILREFPDSRRILLGASIKELGNAITDQARAHHFTDQDIIAYDIENWASTPYAERQDASKSIMEAASLVHRQGYSFGLTPDQKILLQWYAKVDWKQVDFLILQFQTIANDGQTLVRQTHVITEYVKSHNPGIEVFLQLSLRHSDAGHIIEQVRMVRDEIDGVVIAYVPDVTKPPCRYCTPGELEQVLHFLSSEKP